MYQKLVTNHIKGFHQTQSQVQIEISNFPRMIKQQQQLYYKIASIVTEIYVKFSLKTGIIPLDCR